MLPAVTVMNEDLMSNVLCMKRKLKKWWSTIPSISTKLTITSHLKSLRTKKTTTDKCAEAVWSPFKVGDIEKIENVQRRATKQVPTLKKHGI